MMDGQSSTDGGSSDGSGEVGVPADGPVMNCEDTVGSWKSDDDMVFAVIEAGCVITNVCDLSDGTHATGVVTSTQIELAIVGAGSITLDYTLMGDTLTVHGAGPGGSDLVLRPLPSDESIPAECPAP